MYIAVMRVVFDEDCYPSKEWTKGAASLCTRLQSRYKVIAKQDSSSHELAIMIVTLTSDEQKGSTLFDKILESCESFGLGRVLSDDRIMGQSQEIFH